MSYAKMMKWNAKHRKGTKQWMGFNPSGITAKEIDERERKFIEEWKAKTKEERAEFWNKCKEFIALRLGSWEWEWCAFDRAFVCCNGEVI